MSTWQWHGKQMQLHGYIVPDHLPERAIRSNTHARARTAGSRQPGGKRSRRSKRVPAACRHVQGRRRCGKGKCSDGFSYRPDGSRPSVPEIRGASRRVGMCNKASSGTLSARRVSHWLAGASRVGPAGQDPGESGIGPLSDLRADDSRRPVSQRVHHSISRSSTSSTLGQRAAAIYKISSTGAARRSIMFGCSCCLYSDRGGVVNRSGIVS